MPDIVATALAKQTIRPNAGVIQRVGLITKSIDIAGLTTIRINTVAAGDLIVLDVGINSATPQLLKVEGTASLGWVNITAPAADTTVGVSTVLWAGIVDVPGVDDLTFTWSTDVSTLFPMYNGLEFTANLGPATSWFQDFENSGDVTVASGTVTWFNFGAPSNPRELYVAYAIGANDCAAGTTSGFEYSTGDILRGVMAWNPGVTAGVLPTAVQAPAGRYVRAAALLGADPGITNSDTTAEIDFPIVPTGLKRMVYQVMFEVLTDKALGEIIATTYLNGRVLNRASVPGTNQGPPYYTIRPGDDYRVIFTGAPLDSTCVAKFFYDEQRNTNNSNVAGVV